jgi:hypothetical protein
MISAPLLYSFSFSHSVPHARSILHRTHDPNVKKQQKQDNEQTHKGEKLLFFDVVELFAKDFVHREHMHLILLEHQLHLLVAPDLAFVVRVLQVAGFNILPYLLDSLGS